MFLHPFVEIRNEAISLLTHKNITKVNSQLLFVADMGAYIGLPVITVMK